MKNSSEKQSGQKGVKKVLFLIAAGVLLTTCLTFAFAQKYWSGAAQQQQQQQRPRRVTTGGGAAVRFH